MVDDDGATMPGAGCAASADASSGILDSNEAPAANLRRVFMRANVRALGTPSQFLRRSCSDRATWHHQFWLKDLHRLIVLVQGRRAHDHHSLLRPRLRRAN